MGELKSTVAVSGAVEVCLEVTLTSVQSEKLAPVRGETLPQRISPLDSELQRGRTGIGAAGEPGERLLVSNNWSAEIPRCLVLPDLKRSIPDLDKVVESGFWRGWTRRRIREHYAARCHSLEKLAAHCLCPKCGSPLHPYRATGLGPCGLTAEEMGLLRRYWKPGRLAGKGCSHAKKI